MILVLDKLIAGLQDHGVTVSLAGGKLQIGLPWPPDQAPEDARPFLKALKARQEEVKALLSSFNENEAFGLFCEASLRASKTFSSEAWAWAGERQPELVNDILTAEQDYSAAYRRQNMAGCREAAERHEQGFGLLNQAFEKRAPAPGTWGEDLQPMRDTCQQAGHCLGFTQESDCTLFPVELGVCRPRVRRG